MSSDRLWVQPINILCRPLNQHLKKRRRKKRAGYLLIKPRSRDNGLGGGGRTRKGKVTDAQHRGSQVTGGVANETEGFRTQRCRFEAGGSDERGRRLEDYAEKHPEDRWRPASGKDRSYPRVPWMHQQKSNSLITVEFKKRCQDYLLNWWSFTIQWKSLLKKKWEKLWVTASVERIGASPLSKQLYKNSEFCPCEERRRRRGTRQNHSYRQPMQEQVCNVDLWCWTGSVEAVECVWVLHNLRQMGKVWSCNERKKKEEKKLSSMFLSVFKNNSGVIYFFASGAVVFHLLNIFFIIQ